MAGAVAHRARCQGHWIFAPPHTDPSLFDLCASGCGSDICGDVTEACRGRARAGGLRAGDRHPHGRPGSGAGLLRGPARHLCDQCDGNRDRAAGDPLGAERAGCDRGDERQVYHNDGGGAGLSPRATTWADRIPIAARRLAPSSLPLSFRHCLRDGACRVATARAGNVIGGGDWSPFRVVPDAPAFQGRNAGRLRYPQAVRPWQYVLDPLAGYLMLAQAMVSDPAGAPARAQFCPASSTAAARSAELVEALSARWGGRPGWRPDPEEHLHEASLLTLDATRAPSYLGWRPQLSFEDAVTWTADWYRAFWNRKCRRRHPPADRSVFRTARIEPADRSVGKSGGPREGRHPRRRLRDPARGRDRHEFRTDGPDRPASDALAHHEVLRLPWLRGVRAGARLQGRRGEEFFPAFCRSGKRPQASISRPGPWSGAGGIRKPGKFISSTPGSTTMTGGRLRRLAPIVGGETFMLTYGDGVSDVPLDRLLVLPPPAGKAGRR